MNQTTRLNLPATLIGLLAATGLLSGCASNPAVNAPPLTAQEATQPAKGTITVWSWNIAAKALQDISPSFQQMNPGAHVNVDITGASMQTRFMLSLAADVGAPDVSQLQITDAPHYMATGKLADLTAVAAKYQSKFPASRWAECVMNGHVYAIPWDLGPVAIFYKRNIFKEYNINPSSIHTWADYIAAGKKIVALSHGKTKMLALGISGLADMFEIFLQQTHGQVFDDSGRIAVNSPQAHEALQMMRQIHAAGITSDINAYSQEWMAGFNDSSLATYPGAVWLGGIIKDSQTHYDTSTTKWGVFRLPAIQRGGVHVANLGGSVLVIPKQCANKTAAWAFVKYALCTKAGQLMQYEKESLYPSYMPALKSHVMDKPDPFFGGQPVGRLFATDVQKIWRINRTANWAEAESYIQQDLSQWAAAGMPHNHLLANLALSLHQRLDVPLAPTAPTSTTSSAVQQ